MEQIHHFVALARRRLALETWVHAFCAAGVVAALVLLALVIERRAAGLSGRAGMPSGWEGVGAWLAVAALLALLAAGYAAWRAHQRARSVRSVALEVDARLGSGERLSTAIELERAEEPFARAAVADAVRFASDPRVALRLRERFAVVPPERWWMAPTLLLVAVVLWLVLPQATWLDSKNDPDAVAVASDSPRVISAEEERLREMVKAIEQSPALEQALAEELERARRAIAPDADTRTPEDMARESLRRMAELQQRLEEIRGSKETKATETMKDALAKLELPKDSNAARDLSEALKRGDFAEAKKAVAELQQAMKNADLAPEQREALAEALKQTAEQLQKLSQDPGKMAEAMRQAGMDPALAQNPAALKQAIENSPALNQTQKEGLLNMMESMQSSQQKLAQMSQQMGKMAEQCQNASGGQKQDGSQSPQGNKSSDQQQAGAQGGEGGQQQDAAGGMGQMLSEAEASQMMAQAAANADAQGSGGMSESQADSVLRSSCRGDGEGSDNGESQKEGNTGGRGIGAGGNREMKQTAFGTKIQQQRGKRGDGDVIARQLVEGQSPVGESRVALQAVADKIASGVDKGTEDEPVPAHLRAVHQKYFGELQRKLEERGVKASPTPAKPTTEGAK